MPLIPQTEAHRKRIERAKQRQAFRLAQKDD